MCLSKYFVLCGFLLQFCSVCFADSGEKKESSVSMQIAGEINRGALLYDDGDDSVVRNVDNDNDPTLFQFMGTAKFNSELTMGGVAMIEMADNSSARVSQNDATTGPQTFNIRKAEIFLRTKRFGTLYMGRGDTASENAAEQDISGTFTAAHASVQKVGGSLFFSLKNGGVSTVRINQVFDGFDGLNRQSRIRYDLPVVAGFTLSASYADEDQHDVALRFARKYGAFKIKAAAALTDTSSNGVNVDSQFSGSASILHRSGINLTVAGGLQDTEGASASQDPYYIYGKLGYQAKLNKYGFTAFAADFGHYEELRTVNEDGETYGFQMLQKIARWNTDVYLSYRNFQLNNSALLVHNINTVFTGVRFRFSM